MESVVHMNHFRRVTQMLSKHRSIYSTYTKMKKKKKDSISNFCFFLMKKIFFAAEQYQIYIKFHEDDRLASIKIRDDFSLMFMLLPLLFFSSA